MTLINRLIREARDGATVLDIRPQDVGPIADHIRLLSYRPAEDMVAIRAAILDGRTRLRGVTLRVLGQSAVSA